MKREFDEEVSGRETKPFLGRIMDVIDGPSLENNIMSRLGVRWTPDSKLEKQMENWEKKRTREGFVPERYKSIYATAPALPPSASLGYDENGKRIQMRDDEKDFRTRYARGRKTSRNYSRMPRYRKRRSYKRKRYGRRRYSRRRYYGRGAYTMDPGASFGTRWGGYLGSKIGEFGGGWAQRAVGLGDYNVKKNVFDGRLPEMTNLAGNGGTIIRYQEYLGDITTSSTAGDFKNQSFLLNAANESTFPWLSQIAANYDQYEIQGILFEFRSTSGNAITSTNTALGTVMMATQYDTIDQPFNSKVEMLNYEFSTSGLPSQNHTHMVECDPHQTPLPLLFTESGVTNPPNTDPRLYFLGRFQIATQGFQGTNVNAGELHCTYQVKLLKPKLAVTLGSDIGAFIGWANNHTNALPINSSISSNASFNNMAVFCNNNLIRIRNSAVRKFYNMTITWNSSAAGVVIAYPTFTFPANALILAGSTTNATTSPLAGSTAQSCTMDFLFYLTPDPINVEALITCGTATLPSGGTTNVYLRINELPTII